MASRGTARWPGAEAILVPSYRMWNEANERWMLTHAYEKSTYVCFAHAHVAFVANPGASWRPSS
jgi:hypothetical protein